MKREIEAGLVIFVVMTFFVSLYFDNAIITKISEIRTPFFDNFFLIITYISSKTVFFIFLTSLFVWKEEKRRWVVPLWISLMFSGLIAFILKYTVQKQRPFQQGLISVMPSLVEKSYSIWNFSFPSSHSMLAFCALPILSQQFPKLKKIWVGFAVIVALSRVYLGLHFLSDVVAGALIGYVIGEIMVKKEKETHFGKRIYDKVMRR